MYLNNTMSDLKKLTDEQVVDYVRFKDKEAYAEIMSRFQDKLTRYAISLTRDEAKSADIVQNSFLKAFVNLNSFKSKLKFSTWLYRIVHNEAINEIFKHKKETPILPEMDFVANTNLEVDFNKEELKNKARECLSELPLLYSEPLSLFFLEEKSYIEISDILRLPIGTVGTRINRAKLLMKKICQTKQI
jgi:RNA polymerase sigma-70 factor (ECF subfamily)